MNTTRSNADSTVILGHLENLENKMERSFALLNKELRELKATTKLSSEIKASQIVNKNIKLKDKN